MKKHRLHEMSWMEAEEAFKRADTVLMPVGTLHAHGPTPIVEWWSIGRTLMPELFPEGTDIWELAVAIAIGGTEIADVRGGGYKGEWGSRPPLRPLFGEKIIPQGFNAFEFAGAPVTIPVDAWDIDIASPPEIDRRTLEALRRRGQESIERLADYVARFAGEFQRIDVSRALAAS